MQACVKMNGNKTAFITVVAILLIKRQLDLNFRGTLTCVLDPNKSRKKSINSKLRKDLPSFWCLRASLKHLFMWPTKETKFSYRLTIKEIKLTINNNYTLHGLVKVQSCNIWWLNLQMFSEVAENVILMLWHKLLKIKSKPWLDFLTMWDKNGANPLQ